MAGVSAPLMAPSANVGGQAQMALFAAQALEAMKKAVGVGDPTTPLGQAILRALKEIGKQVGGAPPPETQANSLQSQLVEAKRNQTIGTAERRRRSEAGWVAGVGAC